MHVNYTKFERNTSQEYHHNTCIGKTNTQAKEVYSSALPHLYNVPALFNLHVAQRCSQSELLVQSVTRTKSCSDT